MSEKIQKPDTIWRNELTPEQYQVCRQCGTEPAFTGIYWDCHDSEMYRCVCCANALFDSNVKYEFGSGWPSFWQARQTDSITVKKMTVMVWSMRKFCVVAAMPILAMYSKMARNRQDCAIASTPPH
jgi:peptide methionine sulfoxide reductase MsrB